MTMILRTGTKSYFVNIDGSISMEYDPVYNKYFEFEIDDKKVNINNSDIIIQTGGQITFNHNGKKYIIDDGYRDTLVSAGYLCLNLENESEDIEIQKQIRNSLRDNLKNVGVSAGRYEIDESNHLNIFYDSLDYRFTIDIDSINKMIDRNLKRQSLNLPMYPSMRDIPKISSLYYRVYARKTHSAKITRNYNELSTTAMKIMKMVTESPALDWKNISDILGAKDYHLEIKECPIKGVILKWEDNL